MDLKEVRLECLKLAERRFAEPAKAVEAARVFEQYITEGAQGEAPKSGALRVPVKADKRY
jgi:hypothetical protein